MSGKFDATVFAQKTLLAVSQLGESCDINYLVYFLTGSDSEKIREEHRQFESFGCGADMVRQDWLNLIRDLISIGYLKRSTEGSVLMITEKGGRVLKNGERVVLAQAPFRFNENAAAKGGRKTTPQFEPDLLQMLIEVRKYLAKSKEVETEDIVPYMRLHQMATYLPDNKVDLGTIAGFDDQQLNSYGTAFLKVIIEYLGVNNLKSRMHLRRKR